MNKSDDLTDNLESLANFLQDQTGATGVYIGKLVCPKKEIDEDDDDNAHIDEEHPKVIEFMYTSDNHSFMKEKILESDKGVSHDVFTEPSQNEEA